MKKSTLLLLLTCGMLLSSNAQPFQVGHTTVTFNDPSRTGGFGSGGGAGRQIQSEIYYPTTTAGTDVPLSNGNFPVIIFGHGFVMAWDAYQNIWDELVPDGYIMVFPRTEGGFSPSHDEFGMDLAHLVNEMQLLNTNAASLFFNHVDSKTAIMGHSMGGGASFLAAENNTSIETVIGLAPAETTPSAIAAAPNISVPTLVLSGSSDGVTPPIDHHLPIYNGLGSVCKYFISATGGAHCYFANSNFNCDFGEGTASTGISITRPEQHIIMFNYIKPWLNFKLKGSCTDFSNFQSSLQTDSDITYTDDCNLTTPTITAAGSLNLCQGDSVEIFSSSNLDWNQGSSGPFIYASSSGDYFGTDSNCQLSNTLTVTVTIIDTVHQNISMCPGDSVIVGANSYTTAGDYYDTFAGTAGCDSIVHTNLTVNANLNAGIIDLGDSLQVNLAGLSYQWIDCNNANSPIPGETNLNYIPTSSGSYAVIANSGTCSDTSDCFNFLLSSNLIENIFEPSLLLYPNPSTGQVTIEHSNAIRFEIYSVRGDLVLYQSLIDVKTATFDLKSGIYIVKVLEKDNSIKLQKLIIAQ